MVIPVIHSLYYYFYINNDPYRGYVDIASSPHMIPLKRRYRKGQNSAASSSLIQKQSSGGNS
jgi:hypothetical protein